MFNVIMSGFCGMAIYARMTELGHPHLGLFAGAVMCAVMYKVFGFLIEEDKKERGKK